MTKRKAPSKEERALLDIVQTLKHDAEKKKKKKPQPIVPPRLKFYQYKPPHFKDTCVPMTPSMHTRMRYLAHCEPFPYVRAGEMPMFGRGEYDNQEPEDERGQRKIVRYIDEEPCVVSMKTPLPFVQHTDSDTSIINIPSPKTSGEVISAQRTETSPSTYKPPLPPKSGFELFQPHSGIIVNRDSTYVPDVVDIPGPNKVPKKKRRPCYKGGVCRNKYCTKKKCRRRAAALKKKRDKIRARRSAHAGAAYGVQYATDGTPRVRGHMRRPPGGDDDECGLDEIPKPDYPEYPDIPKHAFRTHSMTLLACCKDVKGDPHFGILKGSFNMYSDRFGAKSRGKQGLVMSVMAYCLAFHYHPKQWTMKLIDNLMDAGDQWYMQLLEKQHDHSAYQGICEVLKYGKKEIVLLNQKRMLVLLGEPYLIGYSMAEDPTIYNLCKGLKTFFKENRAGVLMTRVLKLIIWKDRVCFYVFDPAGRNSQAVSNYTEGTAALINVKDETAVADLLLARSILENQRYVLAPVKVLKMVHETSDDDLEDEDRVLTHAEKASMSYRILDESCAIVNAHIHLGDRAFEDAKFRQSLPIAIAALSYAKISPPNTWYSKTLDKILRLGNMMFLDFSPRKPLVDLTIDNIPNEINLGPYTCEIIIYRDRVKGQLFTTKECVFNIRTGLIDFFKQFNSGILDFNNYKIAIWKQKDMYYMFDPYPRTSDGERAKKSGTACCLMLLDPHIMTEKFTQVWDYLPQTMQFSIHAFKILKVKKKEPKSHIKCTLSDTTVHGGKKKVKRKVLPVGQSGDGVGGLSYGKVQPEVMTLEVFSGGRAKMAAGAADEEQMGDIISLVDSIQDDYVPPYPAKYKKLAAQEAAMEPEKRLTCLDSPTVSVTQVVPPWPKPRDKTNELPDEDPSPEPSPPPTPPPPLPPEGGWPEEEEKVEEELDEEALKAKKEEMKRKKLEEEEARRKAEEPPPPLPPPPPSPQPSDTEVPLAAIEQDEDEIETVQPYSVTRHILLTEDARRRYQLRQIRKKMTPPLQELLAGGPMTPDEEFHEPSNYKDLPDFTQIIHGTKAAVDSGTNDMYPFVSIMAIITSYKYSIRTWTKGIVDFVIDSAEKLHSNKKEKFQFAPLHVMPKIAVGNQAYHANIDVVTDGPTWKLEEVLEKKFFPHYDRGMLTTPGYSCAFFVQNGVYYLFDPTPCSPMGLRVDVKVKDKKDKSEKNTGGKACMMRFKTVHDLVARITSNKDGIRSDEQFILSRILVRRLRPEVQYQMPEGYNYMTGKYEGSSKLIPVDGGKGGKEKRDSKEAKDGKEKRDSKEAKDGKEKRDSKEVKDSKKSKKPSGLEEKRSAPEMGYQNYKGVYRIEGTTGLSAKGPSGEVKTCHFVSLVAMLMATIHPLRTWDHFMVDCCIEKGTEIKEKAQNCGLCEKRVIKNILIDGKFINVNIKKIIVINENPEKTLAQYLKAVLRRLRYVMIRFPDCTLVIAQSGGYFHLFDPYSSDCDQKGAKREAKKEEKKGGKGSKRDSQPESETENVGGKDSKLHLPVSDREPKKVAGWTLCRTMDDLICRIKSSATHDLNSPEFYTFELTSVKNAPRHAALNYKLSPLFRPDENPNWKFTRKPRRPTRLVMEKMYWLHLEYPPWTRLNDTNNLGQPRKTPKTMWKDWDIEFPGDLYSLWGTIHPCDERFPEENRGKQIIATLVISLVMVQACDLEAWTASFLDGIVIAGDKFHSKVAQKLGTTPNVELTVDHYEGDYDEFYPYAFNVKFEVVLFGFVYNNLKDRFNLSRALAMFFEYNTMGVLTSPRKNLAFGKVGGSFFMFDCQSFGAPVFIPYQGSAYILKCESLNRLIYCMTMTLNIRRHGQQFHLYSANITLKESKEVTSSKEGKEKKEKKEKKDKNN